MKSQSKLQNLPPEDQQYILDLCANQPYKDVIPLLAQPRPVGLSIKTSVSALCRFYNRVNPLGLRAEITSQLADGLHLRQQLSGSAFNSALLTLVQVHLLDSLKNGKTIEELQSSFRTLHNLQRNWLAFEKIRLLRTEADEDQTLAIHRHDEPIAENEPDYTEIPPSEPAEPNVEPKPARHNARQTAPSLDSLPEPALQSENPRTLSSSCLGELCVMPSPEGPRPNSTENTPPFHTFHRISPASKTEIPSKGHSISEPPSPQTRAA